MSSEEFAHGEKPRASMRHGPAFGHHGPSEPESIEPDGDRSRQLDRRTEAMLVLAVIVPVVAAYGVTAYAVYLVVSALV